MAFEAFLLPLFASACRTFRRQLCHWCTPTQWNPLTANRIQDFQLAFHYFSGNFAIGVVQIYQSHFRAIPVGPLGQKFNMYCSLQFDVL